MLLRRLHHRTAQHATASIVAASLLLAPVGAGARSFSIPNPNPQSFNDVYKVLFGWDLLAGDEYKPNIPKFLEKTKCGGYTEVPMELTIPEVEGVPGRKGEPSGALWSGMATRLDVNGDQLKDNDYEYPDSAEGYTLANYVESPKCQALRERLERPKNGDGPGCEDPEIQDSPMCEMLTAEFGEPENEDPPGCKTPEDCYNKCVAANELVYPVARPALCLHRECWGMAVEVELPEITDEDIWEELLWILQFLPDFPVPDFPWDDPIHIIQTVTEDPGRLIPIIRDNPGGPILTDRIVRIIQQDPGRLQYIVTDKAYEAGLEFIDGMWGFPPPPPEEEPEEEYYEEDPYEEPYEEPYYEEPYFEEPYYNPLQGSLLQRARGALTAFERWAAGLQHAPLTAELTDPEHFELRQDMDLEYFIGMLTEDSLWRLADYIGVDQEELFTLESIPCMDYWDLGILITMDDRGFVLEEHWIEEEYDTADVDYYEKRGASDQIDCVHCIVDEWEDEPILDREESFQLVGYKFHCTASVEEYNTKVEWELDPQPRDERTGELFSQMLVPYGWEWARHNEALWDGATPNLELPEVCKERWVQEPTQYPNCTNCGREDWIAVPGETEANVKDESTPGEECRCGTKPPTFEENEDPSEPPVVTEVSETGFTEQCRLTTRMSPMNGTSYWSFYRTYTGTYTRAAPVVPGETLSQEAPVFCYEFYNERDTKFQQTTGNDQRCIIDIDVSQLTFTNAGKGEYWPPRHGGPDQNNGSDMRTYPDPNTEFDQREDLWFLNFGRAFSMLNGDLVRWDLARALLSLDAALQWVLPQTDSSPLAEHLRIRSFDHTGQYMTMTVWSNEQTSRAQRIFRPAELHVYLPGALDFGAGSSDNRTDWSVAPEERRGAPITLQVDSGESIVDAVVTLLEKTYSLSLREEPLSVVVPLGSPAEFRTLSQKWCAWWMLRSGSTDCVGASGDVQALMQRFDEYADSIEDLRMLRSQLSLQLGATINAQNSILGPIIEWMTENLTLFQQYIDQRNALLGMVPEWEQIEALQRSLGETTMMPWCKNDRFLLSPYSLLDPWLPTRGELGMPVATNNAGKLPSLPMFTIPTFPKDLVLDLSELHLPSASEGGIPVPVLHVVQVRLNLDSFEPPDPMQEEVLVPEPPPSFPPVADVLGTLEALAATVGTPNVIQQSSPPLVTFPVLPQLEEVEEALADMAPLLALRNQSYHLFWRSIGPLKPGDEDATTEAKELHWCERTGDKACKHVEQDLMERFQLIGAPPAVLREDDLERWTEPRHSPDTCKPWDEACMILHPEDIRQRTGWQVVPPDDTTVSPMYDAANAALRAPWLRVPLGERSPEDALPYDVSGPDLTPAFRAPEVMDLSPSGIDLSTIQ